MTNAEYEDTQRQIMLLGSLVRVLDLDAFIAKAQSGLDHGALLQPSHWIAGHKKLELIITLAQRLRAFQDALPDEDEALKLDADAARDMKRLGIAP